MVLEPDTTLSQGPSRRTNNKPTFSNEAGPSASIFTQPARSDDTSRLV